MVVFEAPSRKTLVLDFPPKTSTINLMKIIRPSQAYVRSFEDEVKEVMEALGPGLSHSFVTDKSRVDHFWMLDRDDAKFDERVAEASRKLGIVITKEDLVHEVAARLFKKKTG